MTGKSQFIELARTLPPTLQKFLTRYPPLHIVHPTKDDPVQTFYQVDRPNPFLASKDPITGARLEPIYSLRRQADLVKMARTHGVEELLPFTKKKTEVKLKHRVTYGLRVKGTGVGQKVKGHAHERNLFEKYVLSAGGFFWAQTHANQCDCTGWRRGERLCSTCPNSSGNGRLYVPPLSNRWATVMLTLAMQTGRRNWTKFPK